jgi:hypothetical protein
MVLSFCSRFLFRKSLDVGKSDLLLENMEHVLCNSGNMGLRSRWLSFHAHLGSHQEPDL